MAESLAELCPSNKNEPQRKAAKLLRIPATHRIQKRPPIRPAIACPYTGAKSPKVIYVSSKMPFMSAVKRTRSLLDLVEKRAIGRVSLVDSKAGDRQRLRTIDPDRPPDAQKSTRQEEILLRGTGKAIAQVMKLALYFQGQADLGVRLATGSIGAIDDIVQREDFQQDDKSRCSDTEETTPTAETQVRFMSMLEVGVSLR